MFFRFGGVRLITQPYVTELDLRQSLIPMQLIEHLASIMPKDVSGEGYDYDAFLDVLVNGGGKENFHSNERTAAAAGNRNAVKSNEGNRHEGRVATGNGKENAMRDVAGNASNVANLAVTEAEVWGSGGGMARRSRNYL